MKGMMMAASFDACALPVQRHLLTLREEKLENLIFKQIYISKN